MKNINCIIIDDEELTILHLIKYINKVPNIKLERYFIEPTEAIEYLKNNRVDVIFIDVEMPNSNLDGIEFIKLMGEQNYVLTTAHPEYALKGFDYSVIDFLHKPYSFDRFLLALNKIEKIVNVDKTTKSNDETEEIYIKNENVLQKILIKEICYVKSEKNNISIYTDTDRINALFPLSELEKKLPVQKFIRVHKCYLIALSKISSISFDEIIIKKGNDTKNIPLGNVYKAAFMNAIEGNILKKGF